MKNKLEFIPLILFIVTSMLSFLAGNFQAGLGFLVASMVQTRVIALLYISEEKSKEEEEK